MRKLVRILLWVLGVSALIAGILYMFFDPWVVPGDDAQFAVSIEPTLSANDVVLVSRVAGATDGNLVRCADPDSPGRFVVGRVVGSGSDHIEFKAGSMLVNDHTPSTPYACDEVHLISPATQEEMALQCSVEELGGKTHPMLRGKAVDREVSVTNEPGKVFLVSDDRVLHLDSRDFGQVSAGSCHAIILRLWGSSGWGDNKHRLTMIW